MDFVIYLIFLAAISCLDLLIIGLILFLDFAKVHTEQKLNFIKFGLFLIGIAPVTFFILKAFSWHTIEIKLHGNLINKPLTSAVSIQSYIIPVNWSFYVFMIYTLGLSIMLLRILSSYIYAKRQLSKSSSGVVQGQVIFFNKSLLTPLSFGFIKTKIYFPLDAERKWSSREIEMSLTHEKIHLQQKDSLWKLFSLIVQALLFFAPWSYYLHRRFELEMEIFCDRNTCEETSADINEYGSLLLKMVSAFPKNPVFNHLTSSILKRRFLAMKTNTIKKPLFITSISILLFLAFGAVIAMTAGIKDKKSVFDITSKIFIDGKLISTPHIVVKANQVASIFISDNSKTNSLRMEVVAKNGISDAILMIFDVQYKNGGEEVHYKPEFVLAPNQEGTFRISSKLGHLYEMRVIGQRD